MNIGRFAGCDTALETLALFWPQRPSENKDVAYLSPISGVLEFVVTHREYKVSSVRIVHLLNLHSTRGIGKTPVASLQSTSGQA